MTPSDTGISPMPRDALPAGVRLRDRMGWHKDYVASDPLHEQVIGPPTRNSSARRGSPVVLASRLRLFPQKVLVVVCKVVALPVGLQNVVEVVRVRGAEGGLQRLAARA